MTWFPDRHYLHIHVLLLILFTCVCFRVRLGFFHLTKFELSILSFNMHARGEAVSNSGIHTQILFIEEVLNIAQSSKAGASPSASLASYPRHSLGGGSYPSALIQSVHSAALVDLGDLVYASLNH